MTRSGLQASQVLAERYADVVTTLTPEEWASPSRCVGWTVKDLVAHASSNFKAVVEPPAADPTSATPAPLAEQAMEWMVAERRDWSTQQVAAELVEYQGGWLAALSALQDEPTASVEIPMSELGTYSLHSLADAFAFDLACHLYIDLLSPEGPVVRDLPKLDDDTLSPGVGWMLTGLPQMCPAVSGQLTRPLGLRLTGPGGGEWTLEPGESLMQVREKLTGDIAATIESSTWDFMLWGTARTPWRNVVGIQGDADYAASVLDRINII
jgi:uncharacterized protein (TIGR03083 family)